jgi:Putative Actinobacterial Holin-X, holin superfamily III
MAQIDESDRRLREQSMSELFKQLSDDLSTLVRQELSLAQAEMTEKGKQVGLGAGMFGGAGVITLVALGTFSTFVIAALSKAIDVWLAALIVTVIYAVVAGALALSGKQRVAQATPAVPEQTVDTLKEDAQWAKTRLQSESR